MKRRASLLSLLQYPNSQTWKPNRNSIFREGDFVTSVVAPGVFGVVRRVDDFIHKVYVQWNGGELIQMEPEYLTLNTNIDPELRARFAPTGEVDIDYKLPEVNRKQKSDKIKRCNEMPELPYSPVNPDFDYKKYSKERNPAAAHDRFYEETHLDRQENGPRSNRSFKTFHDNVLKGKNVKTIPEVVKNIVDDNFNGPNLKDEDMNDNRMTPEKKRLKETIEKEVLGRTASLKPRRRPNVYLAKEMKERKFNLMHPLSCPGGQDDEPRFSMQNEMILRQVKDGVEDALAFASGVDESKNIEPLSNGAKGGKEKPHSQEFIKAPKPTAPKSTRSKMIEEIAKSVAKNIANRGRRVKKK